MMPVMPLRLILDANVIVSALISPKSPPGLILKQILCDNPQIKLVMSREILSELAAVLAYPSVKKHLRISDRDIDDLMTDFELISELYDTSGHDCEIKSRDPDDDKYLLLAEVSKPDFLVSGDSDLTDILVIGSVRIVKPRAFLDILTV